MSHPDFPVVDDLSDDESTHENGSISSLEAMDRASEELDRISSELHAQITDIHGSSTEYESEIRSERITDERFHEMETRHTHRVCTLKDAVEAYHGIVSRQCRLIKELRHTIRTATLTNKII